MKLYINEKIFSLHHRFFIKDEQGNDVLEMSSQMISIGRKTWIKDLNGNELAYMEQEILHLMPHYNIYVNGALLCQITKKFKLLKNDYELSNGYKVDGNIFALDFTIADNTGKTVGILKRKFFSIGDKYEIEILDEKDYILILAIIMAITNDVNNKQRSSTYDND